MQRRSRSLVIVVNEISGYPITYNIQRILAVIKQCCFRIGGLIAVEIAYYRRVRSGYLFQLEILECAVFNGESAPENIRLIVAFYLNA